MQNFTTLAGFKKLIKTGVKVSGIFHKEFAQCRDEQGKPIYRDVILEPREVVTCQTNAFTLLTTRKDGKTCESWLHYPKANECEVLNGNTLIIYEEDRDGSKSKVLTYQILE